MFWWTDAKEILIVANFKRKILMDYRYKKVLINILMKKCIVSIVIDKENSNTL